MGIETGKKDEVPLMEEKRRIGLKGGHEGCTLGLSSHSRVLSLNNESDPELQVAGCKERVESAGVA